MGKKDLNPVDAYRKEQKKKEHKKHQYEKRKLRETGNNNKTLTNNPEKLELEIRRVQKEAEHNKLDKGLQERLQQLQALKFSSERNQIIQPKTPSISEPQVRIRPEDSVYYDPKFNPMGTPPPGYPPMYRTNSSSHQIPTPRGVNYGYLNTQISKPPLPHDPSTVFPTPLPPPLPSYTNPSVAKQQLPKTVDPLDPSASGYTQRFGSELLKRKRQIPDVFSPPQYDFQPSIPEENKSQIDEQDVPLDKEPQMETPETVNPLPHVEVEAPCVDLVELMKRRKTTISKEYEVVGPTLPTSTSTVSSNPLPPPPPPPPTTTSTMSVLGICYSSDSETEDVAIDQPHTVSSREPSSSDPSSDIPGNGFDSFQTLPYHNPHLASSSSSLSSQLSPSIMPLSPPPIQQKQLVESKPPKPVQVESELVSFIPAALRIKRNMPPQQLKSKTQSQPSSFPSPSTLISSREIDSGRSTESVDAAYEAFMSEINQLGN